MFCLKKTHLLCFESKICKIVNKFLNNFESHFLHKVVKLKKFNMGSIRPKFKNTFK